MRLPFPERIPLPAAFVAATVLTGLQQLQRTALYFSFYTFLVIIFATIAFNLAGGFTRPSGSYIFFYAVLGVVEGLVYKAFLGEPAESNLRSPILTMQVFTGGMAAMCVAALISRKFRRRRGLLSGLVKEKDEKNAAVGCFAVGMVIVLLDIVNSHKDGSILSALTQLNHFLNMSIIIGTLYTIKVSRGRTGFSTSVLVYIGTSIALGIMYFSKQGMFTPLLCWLVAAASLRLRIRGYQIALGLIAVYFMFHIMVPYSQYGRNLVPEGISVNQRISLSYSLLSDPASLISEYSEAGGGGDDNSGNMDYYDKPQGFFDRLTMIGPDDALVSYTSQTGPIGLDIIPAYFANWIPHFLWPGKPGLASGNLYAHQIGGILSEEDTSTGISFTPTGEAYHLAGWTGVFVVAPIIWTMLFLLFDSLCGDTRSSPWGLLMLALFAHIAPEGMLGGVIYAMWFNAVGLIFVALATGYLMPVIGTLIAGPEKTGLIRTRGSTVVTTAVPHPGPDGCTFLRRLGLTGHRHAVVKPRSCAAKPVKQPKPLAIAK